jgi:DNA-binding transcriptional ArsR family regulator
LPIRIILGEAGPSFFRFAASPLMEALLSLHVLGAPKKHPLQHGWVRDMRRLPAALKQDVRALAFLYEDALPDCFLPTSEAPTFEFELERFAGLDADAVAYELARPLFHYHEPAAGGPERLSDPAVRKHVIDWSAYHGEESARLAGLIFSDPAALQARVIELVSAYWEAAFAAEWARIEPLLYDEMDDARQRIGAGGTLALLDELRPAIRVDDADRAFVRPSPHEHDVAISPAAPLHLVPSVYVWPHVRVNCDPPWPLTLIYPAGSVRSLAALEQPPDDLVAALRAAGDATRLRALRLIAERPRSTEELAPLVGISEAGLSKHLRQLADAGLVHARREGYYVLYDLDRERVAALGGELGAFVNGSEAASAPAPPAPATSPRRA